MNREFEILNEKLNIIFEELMWLRRDFKREKYEKEVKELEYKAKNAQDEINYKKDDSRFLFERIDESMNHFRTAELRFPKNEMNCACERVERQ